MKLLEVLGEYADRGSIIVFVDKQEHADGLLKVRIIILLRLKGHHRYYADYALIIKL